MVWERIVLSVLRHLQIIRSLRGLNDRVRRIVHISQEKSSGRSCEYTRKSPPARSCAREDGVGGDFRACPRDCLLYYPGKNTKHVTNPCCVGLIRKSNMSLDNYVLCVCCTAGWRNGPYWWGTPYVKHTLLQLSVLYNEKLDGQASKYISIVYSDHQITSIYLEITNTIRWPDNCVYVHAFTFCTNLFVTVFPIVHCATRLNVLSPKISGTMEEEKCPLNISVPLIKGMKTKIERFSGRDQEKCPLNRDDNN